MKRIALISLLAAAVGVMAFIGCEKPEEIEIPVASKPQTTDNSVINAQPTNMANQQTTDTTNQQIADTANSQNVIHNTALSYSDCHSNQRNGIYEELLSNYSNGVLQLMIENLGISCGVYHISDISEVDEQTINVDFRIIYESQANCICNIDVDYSIDNIKPGTYELIVSVSNWVIYQEEITCE